MASGHSKTTTQLMLNHARKEQTYTQRTLESDAYPQSSKYPSFRETPKSPKQINKIKDYSSDEEEENYDYLKSSQVSDDSFQKDQRRKTPKQYQQKEEAVYSKYNDRQTLSKKEPSYKTITHSLRDSSKKRGASPKQQRKANHSVEQRKKSLSKRANKQSIAHKSTYRSSSSSLSSVNRSPSPMAKSRIIRNRSKSLSKKTITVQKENIKQRKSSNSNPKKKTVKKAQGDQTLAQRLLQDITEKYKNINSTQGSCYINKIEKKTMVHEINTLANALIKNEKKLAKLQDNEKKKLRDLRKVIKVQDEEEKTLVQENKDMHEFVKQLKSNEEHLVHDLMKQQKIAKDSLKALENMSDKYDKEKRELILRMEREKEDCLKREESKFQLKISSLKSLNDQLNGKLGMLSDTEEDFGALQKNYNEATMIIEEQKRELQQLMREMDDLKTRNGQLEDEVRDIQGMLQEQQKIYSAHINELRLQLNELEDATRNKYDEQIVALQMDLKMKTDHLNRVVQEKTDLERKMKSKLEEAGLSNKQVLQEVQEKQEEKEEMQRLIKNQEFELEKLKRIINNKDEELETEKKRFNIKWERKCEELDKERQDWNEMYQTISKEQQTLKVQLHERDNQLHQTMRRSLEGQSYRSSILQSPNSKMIYVEGQPGNNNQILELQEQLKTKEEEIKILWNVIKEINKSKGSEKVNMDQLKSVISSKVSTSYSTEINNNY